MQIEILPENVINQIAAGEVVENPASVVKELVENALDAGAKKIQIEIRGGGFQLIRISDDGTGMGEDDALLSFERHGTSKIRSSDDLHTLHSMGFRGEAIASICSISKMTLLTSSGEVATRILAEGGKILRKERAARARGTTFEIRSLFFNTPARKRFQKSALSSQGEITKLVTKLALAYPEIHFILQANEKEILQVKPGDLGKRVSTLLGKEFLDGAKWVDQMGLRGYLGSIVNARSNRSGQYLFINKRLVQCLPVSWGVEEGYGTRLPARRYPTFVLFLEIPPAELDVNVHPQKLQVRLAKEQGVRDLVQSIVAQSFIAKKEVVQLVAQPRDFSFDLPKTLPAKLEEEPERELFTMPHLTSIGKFGAFYIAQKDNNLYLFDLRAALSLLYFDEAMKEEKKLPLSQMLLPQTLEFSPHEAQKIAENLSLIEQLGIGIRPFGESAFVIDSLSSWIDEVEVRSILEEWLEERGASLDAKQKLALKIARAAKRKKDFTRFEAHEIAESVIKKSLGALAPDGKSVYKILSEEDLERVIANKKVPASAI